jgi:hypothetical protein
VTVAKAYRLLHAIFETRKTTESSPATRATSTGRARKSRTNARSFRFRSSSRSPKLFRCGIAPWGGLRTDAPKSQAGKRIVAFPAEIATEIRWHLERFAEPGDRGFVFVGPKGGKLRRSNFHKSVWSKVL